MLANCTIKMIGNEAVLVLNEWMSVENQSTEIGLKTYREEVFLIVSLKTVSENLNQQKVTIRQIRMLLYLVYGKNTGEA